MSFPFGYHARAAAYMSKPSSLSFGRLLWRTCREHPLIALDWGSVALGLRAVAARPAGSWQGLILRQLCREQRGRQLSLPRADLRAPSCHWPSRKKAFLRTKEKRKKKTRRGEVERVAAAW